MDFLESLIICNSGNPPSSRLLCDDLWVEILCRLPEKPLIRFKCVCKAWHCLISEVCLPRVLPASLPLAGLYFRTYTLPDMPLIRRGASRDSSHAFYLHLARTQDQEHMDYTSLEDNRGIGGGGGGGFLDSAYYTDLPFRQRSAENFLDSCNGLLLFRSASDFQYYVCNPMTRQCVPIPKARCHRHHLYAALAFNPSESPCYKIVRFALLQIENQALDIFSSDTGQWVRHLVQLDPQIRETTWLWQSVYFEGALYRLSLTWNLVRFDLNEVSARVIELPMTEMGGRNLMGCIGVSMGRLCYAKEEFNRLLIWSFRVHCEAMKWTLKYSISMSSLKNDLLSKGHACDQMLWFQPCAIHPTSDVIFLGTPLRILSYDLKRNRLEEVYRTTDGIMIIGCFYPAFTHVRFPVSLNHLGKIHCRSTQLKTISEGMRVLSLETPSEDLEGIHVQITNGSA
uniref:Uncharacterized protein n=1 Tax=Davidia involucrata TaxID=16924 RepID=A0A5B6YJK0_DAVIN